MTDDPQGAAEGLPTFLMKGNPFAKSEKVEEVILRGMTSIAGWDRGGRIYASQSAHCARQTALYSNDGETSIMSPSGNAYMAMGNAIEGIIIEALRKQKALLFSQYRLPDIGVNMGGKIDAIALIDEKLKCLEIKSCGKLPVAPKLEHAAQAMMYEAVTGIPTSVLYFSRTVADYRGNLLMRNIPLNATRAQKAAALFTVCYAHYANEMGVIPPKPPFESKAECGWCKYVDICWEGAPLPGRPVTAAQHKELAFRAREKVEELMDEDNVKARRTGILKFIMHNGTEAAAKDLWNKSWEALI